MVLVIGVALVAALIARHSRTRGELRTLALLAGLALGVRLVAITIVYFIAIRVHPEGVWLNDEASYFLATQALLPWPWDRALPQGLDHLGGNGYLGLTTAISGLIGQADALEFRFANSIFGTLVVILCAWLAQRFFGRTAGLVAGVAAALYPDLILWSATFLRDTLGSLAVVGVWYALVSATRQRWVLNACFVVLSVVLLGTLREYLAIAVAVGVLAWLVYPVIRRQRPRILLGAALGLVVVGGALGVWQARRIDEAMHQVLYRQTVTRMETLGLLYRDPVPPGQPMQLPFRPGVAIALTDPNTGWLLPGLVDDSAQPGLVAVDLIDNTSRSVPISDVVLLQDARIPPLQLFSWVLPSMASVFAGLPDTTEAPNIGWISAALAWDVLVVVAIVGLVRARPGLRHLLFPVCVILGTVAALSAIPGAPGNAERHRATQTVPLLLVFASGIFASSRARLSTAGGRSTSSASNMPIRATTAVASSKRSLR